MFASFIIFIIIIISLTDYPNMNQTINEDKCQSIYLNLLESLRIPGLEIGPVNYIRALNQTARCDKFDTKGAVKTRRKDYVDYLKGDRYQRRFIK
jgi:hypothetical protein